MAGGDATEPPSPWRSARPEFLALGLFEFQIPTPAEGEVAPKWGTCAIFNTTDRSVHGVKPITGKAPRRSSALYYYTSAPTPDFSGDHSTHWRAHSNVSILGRVRVGAYRICMKLSRAFSMLAHLINPDFGLRAVHEHREARRRNSQRQPPS